MTRSELQLVPLATASASGRSPSPTRAGRDAAAVVAITALAFLPALRNGFVEFDDQQNILENPMFRGLGPGRIGWMFTTFHMGHWQPLSWVSLGLDYTLWGLDPLGYHLTNLVLHLTSAAVLFLLARRLLSRTGIPSPGVDAGAAIGALLWAVHPLRVESVVWITERRDVLSGLFVLLALLAWIQPADRRSRLPLTIVAAVLALLSKGSAMVLPVLFVVLDVYPLRLRPRGGRARLDRPAAQAGGGAVRPRPRPADRDVHPRLARRTYALDAGRGHGSGERGGPPPPRQRQPARGRPRRRGGTDPRSPSHAASVRRGARRAGRAPDRAP